MFKDRFAVSGIVLAWAFCGALAYGQATTAQINGTVTDPANAAVPGAAISVRNIDSGISRETSTNEQGNYSVPLLPPGNYRLSVARSGFKTVAQGGIALAVNQVARLDIALEIGSVAEAIEVAAVTPLVEQDSSALGQVVDNSKVVNIPINGRSPFRLLQLTTNVISMPSSYGQFKDIPVNTQDDAAFSINGGRAYSNELLIDGIPATTGVSNQITTIPNVDSTLEFKVQSSNLSAEFGRFGGGVVNVSTRSGTNQLHGSLFEFVRNDKFDANDFFNKRAGRDIPAFRLNQFGYALGGPVFLPRVYNGRNRTFFFTDYQGTEWRRGSVFLGTVPTLAQRQGDFRQTLSQRGQAIVIYNPLTSRPDPSRPGNFLRDPFPGNVIPRDRIDPVAAKLTAFYPEANTAGDPLTQTNNYISNANNGIGQYALGNKIDHSITQAWKVFGRVSVNRSTLTFGDVYCTKNEYCNPASPTNGKVIVNNYTGALDNTITLDRSTILNVRYGFARYFWTRTGRGLGFDQRQLGLPDSLVNQQSIAYFPISSVEGFSALGGGSLVRKGEDTHTVLASVIRIAGKHNIKAGVDFRLRRSNYFELANGGGQYGFTRAMTRGPDPNVVTETGGLGFASLLLGTPSSGSTNSASGFALQGFYSAAYVQDDIRVSRRLTVNLGLRYETESPYAERYNQLNWFDFALPSPVRNSAFPNLNGGLVFADADHRTVYTWDRNNVAPRVGFAYSLRPSLVLRGGGGVFFAPLGVSDQVSGFAPNSGYSTTTPLVASLDGITPNRFLSNPYPEGLTKAAGNSLGARTFLGQAVNVWQRGVSTPYTLQWNADVQKSFGRTLLLDAAYSASRGLKLNRLREFNALDPDYLSLGARLQTLVDNPFYPSITAGALAQPKVQMRQLLLPYPQYTSVALQNDGSGASTYHSMALKLEKRAAQGVSFLVSYTVSKLLSDVRNMQGFNGANPGVFNTSPQNWYDLRSEWAVSESDVSQSLSISYVAELPFGAKHRFLSGARGIAGGLVGGWQLSGFFAARAGFPLVVSAPIPGGGNRPNSTGKSADVGGGRSRNDQVNRWFDTAAFVLPPSFSNGNVSRTLPDVRGPGYANWDMSLAKNTRIRESVTAQFRFESFNVLNRPIFSQPNTALGNLQFGQINGTLQLPRVNQLALKVIF